MSPTQVQLAGVCESCKLWREKNFCSIIFGANNRRTCNGRGGGGRGTDRRHMAYISTCIHKSYCCRQEQSAGNQEAAGILHHPCAPDCAVCMCVCPLSSRVGYFKDIYTDSGFLMEKLL